MKGSGSAEINRKLLCLMLLSVCILVFRCADGESVVAHGTVGSSILWLLMEDDSVNHGLCLNITGSGSMPDWSDDDPSNSPPWSGYKESITSISLGSGITAIGSNAFSDCCILKNITFPDTLISVGAYAFSECSLLEELDLPAGLTEIDSYAFSRCDSLRDVSIPQNVNSLGCEAFSGCSNLETINIPGGIVCLEHGLFQGCSSLRSLSLPSSLKSICGGLIAYCDSLETISIPAGVDSIEPYAFNCSYGLKEINVEAGNQYYCSESGVLFNREKTKLIQYPCARPDEEYTVPSSVTEIGDSAFYFNSTLRVVHLPESIVKIGDSAFGDSRIRSVNIPSGLQNLGEGAFVNCSNMRGTDLVIPGAVKEIKDLTFASAAFRSLVLEEGIVRIGKLNFNLNFASEATVTLPASVMYISDEGIEPKVTFRCHHESIAEMVIRANGNPIVYTCDERLQVCPAAAENDGYVKIGCPICGYHAEPATLISHNRIISIPLYARIIEEDAFSNIAAEQVCIPDTVERIDAGAFAACANLRLAVFSGMKTAIENDAFDFSSGIVFYCPEGSDAEKYALEHGIPYFSY